MNFYNALSKQKFSVGEYSIVPIRSEDRYRIMEWRNEQMYHLRQNVPLTKQKQDIYFDVIIKNLFVQEKPEQILFSFLEREECVGYGGLVHINWIDKYAEISFILNTELEEIYFEKYWEIFLELLEEVAFKELNLHKISTYALDLRPKLYPVLENYNYFKEARLKKQCVFNETYVDVVIHSKFSTTE